MLLGVLDGLFVGLDLVLILAGRFLRDFLEPFRPELLPVNGYFPTLGGVVPRVFQGFLGVRVYDVQDSLNCIFILFVVVDISLVLEPFCPLASFQ